MDTREGVAEGVVEIDGVEEQLLFSFVKVEKMWDKPCRTCEFALWYIGRETKRFDCGMGQWRGCNNVRDIPVVCRMWKEGGERMSFVNFKKLTEEQLKLELEKIRTGRLGTGKGARRASRERRVKDGERSQRQKATEEQAEWI